MECRNPRQIVQRMAPADAAWLAGIIEGEGTFGLGEHRYGTICVVMTDADIIERIRSMTNVGSVYHPAKRQAHHKQPCGWAVYQAGAIASLYEIIAPLLSERRRDQAQVVADRQGLRPVSPREPQPGTDEAWGWVAGIIEGEGYIGTGPGAKHPRFLLTVDSTDRDVVTRVARLTGVGSAYLLPARRDKPHWKPLWTWRVTNKADITYVLEAVLPLLGKRRAERARYVLERASHGPRSRARTCASRLIRAVP
jgi:hypothetical protein